MTTTQKEIILEKLAFIEGVFAEYFDGDSIKRNDDALTQIREQVSFLTHFVNGQSTVSSWMKTE